MVYIAQSSTSSIPEDSKEAIRQFKETADLLHEFREPTKQASANNSFLPSSPIALYFIYSVIFCVLAIAFLYWRYKNSR